MDQLEAKMSSSSALYLKQIDRCSPEWSISAFVTPSYTKFLLVHPHKMDDSTIKAFFNEIHEVYVKMALSPFSDDNLGSGDMLKDKVSDASKALLKAIKWN